MTAKKRKPCYLCGSREQQPVPGKVRDLPKLRILKCLECELVFLENFNHIRPDYYDRVYPKGHYEPADWKQFINDCRQDDLRRAKQLRPMVLNKRFLDVGCGAGGLLLELKEHCKAVYGVEPQSRWRSALESENIPVYESLDQVKDRSVDVIGMFHVLEHLPDPIGFLKNVVKKLAPGGCLFIEVPHANDALLQLYRSRAFSEFTYWSPHLYLYTPGTLSRIFHKAGITNFQTRQYQRYSLSNHLYWLSHGLPGGHQKWSFLDTPILTQAYADSLGALGLCDTLISIISPTNL